jgi:hypothetical protein
MYNYRITGIFCGYLISAVFCGQLLTAEIRIAEYYMLEKQFVLHPVTQSIFFRRQDFQTSGEKTAENKCLFFFGPKPQNFHTEEITSFTVYITLHLHLLHVF